MAATMPASGSWSYAVPLDEAEATATSARSPGETVDKDSRALSRKSSGWDLMSDSETAKQRRTSLRTNNTSASRKRSRNQLRDRSSRPADGKTGDRVDDSAWIHRDKLAEIEIQEMEEAGIYVPNSYRPQSAGRGRQEDRTSRSRSRSRRPTSRASRKSLDRQNDISNDEDYTAAYPGQDDTLLQRISTTPYAHHDSEEMEQEEEMEHDQNFEQFNHQHSDPTHGREGELRSLADLAAEMDQRQQTPSSARPGTSRIPVSRASPVPVSQNGLGLDSPVQRSRADSQNWSGNLDEMQNTYKARSGSVSSQAVRESNSDKLRTTPPEGRNKTWSNDDKAQPKSVNAQRGVPSAKQASTSGNTAPRPGSSHATNTARSPSSNRSSMIHHAPDGEPPWLANMYKPDPRLPPDQQMLPTHAKRMMQEMWEKEGKTGSAYDRDFKLLNDNDFKKPMVATALNSSGQGFGQPSRNPSPSTDRPAVNGSGLEDLSPTSLERGDASKREPASPRPGTSGGYRITPTIPSTPTIERSAANSPMLPPPMAHPTSPRVPEIEEKDDAKSSKRGCCCIVM